MAHRSWFLAVMGLALSGCVVTPAAVHVALPGNDVALGRVVVAVERPDAVPADGLVVPWNEVRLTFTASNGSGAIYYTLVSQGGRLLPSSPLGRFPAGSYQVHTDLLQAYTGRGERVVAMDDQQTVQLQTGLNDLQLRVHGVVPGQVLALAPLDALARTPYAGMYGGGGSSYHHDISVDEVVTVTESEVYSSETVSDEDRTVVFEEFGPDGSRSYPAPAYEESVPEEPAPPPEGYTDDEVFDFSAWDGDSDGSDASWDAGSDSSSDSDSDDD